MGIPPTPRPRSRWLRGRATGVSAAAAGTPWWMAAAVVEEEEVGVAEEEEEEEWVWWGQKRAATRNYGISAEPSIRLSGEARPPIFFAGSWVWANAFDCLWPSRGMRLLLVNIVCYWIHLTVFMELDVSYYYMVCLHSLGHPAFECQL